MNVHVVHQYLVLPWGSRVLHLIATLITHIAYSIFYSQSCWSMLRIFGIRLKWCIYETDILKKCRTIIQILVLWRLDNDKRTLIAVFD